MSDVHAGQPQGLASLDEPGDAELISAVRGGDLDAYGTLFARHVDAARRLARQLVSSGDVDDLVSDAFAKVLAVLQRGGGPDLAFRAYLLTSLRRLHVDRLRAGARLTTTDDLTPYDPGVPFEDTAVSGFDNAAAAKAFASLPERWQQVLWHTEVEGQKPADIAPLLGISANSVSALAYRAREGLRQAFISMHAQDATEDACITTRANLGAYLRGGISRRDGAKVEDHLGGCRECSGIYLELAEVNNDLGAVLAPMLLGSAGAGYLAAAHVGAIAAAKGGVLFFLGRTRDWVLHNPVGRVAAGATGAVAAAAVVAGVALAHGGSGPVAERHAPAAKPSSSPAASSAPDTPATPKASKPHAKPQQTPVIAVPAQVAPVLASPSPPAPPTKTAPVIRTPLAPISMSAAGPVTIDLTKGATDPNGDALEVVSATVKKPSHGKVAIDRGSGSGRQVVGRTLADVVAPRRAGGGPTSVTYTPAPGWRGADTIAYVLGDGHGGTVDGTVKVTTPDAAPVARPDTVSAPAVWLGSTPTAVDVLANDSDPNHDTLQVTQVTQPSHGHVVLGSSGSVSYTAAVGYTGADSFTYAISDGHGGTATGTVNVTVGALPDRLPTADTAPRTIADDQTATITVPDDPDGDELTLTASATTGSATVTGQKITYTPPFGQDSDATVHYTVSDGKRSESASVEVTARAPRRTLVVTNGHAAPLDGDYLKTRPVVGGIPTGRKATVTVKVNGLTSAGFANNEGEACAKIDTATGTATCTLTGTDTPTELGHYDPYATSITVTVHAIDFIADDVTWTYGGPGSAASTLSSGLLGLVGR